MEHLLYSKPCSKCCRYISKQERHGPCFHGAYMWERATHHKQVNTGWCDLKCHQKWTVVLVGWRDQGSWQQHTFEDMRRQVLVKGRGISKALSEERALHVYSIEKRPVWLEQSQWERQHQGKSSRRVLLIHKSEPITLLLTILQKCPITHRTKSSKFSKASRVPHRYNSCHQSNHSSSSLCPTSNTPPCWSSSVPSIPSLRMLLLLFPLLGILFLWICTWLHVFIHFIFILCSIVTTLGKPSMIISKI